MIKSKSKPCKGTGISKGYGCGKPVINRAYGLGKMCCYANWLLNSENGKIKLQKATLKATKPRLDLQNAEREHKERIKLATLLKSVEKVCHEFVRKRDKAKPCISCGTVWNSNFQAGHFYKAELFSNLKFNEYNINGQCQQCNLRKDGNINSYEINLPKRIGIDNFKKIQNLASVYKKENFKWDRNDLKKIRDYYKLKLKNL